MEAAPPNSQRKVLNKNLNLVLCLNKGFYDMKKPFPHDAVTCNGSCLPATIITSELMYYAKDNKSKVHMYMLHNYPCTIVSSELLKRILARLLVLKISC